ncbi:hypothetical protein NLJ89_g5681 [Agrocybe chaxingu]|uniref:Response regulatory domain-containing protein n=1 Tax=Agrocybe chaxingu TaxID=84603 RepID=A0A9W8MX38_9AGAR|nr:hypothetical protein NLJ89_g5681 [Agrocybe chaxingu]
MREGGWSFDASGLAAGGMLGSMDGGSQGVEQQQQYASGSYAGDDGEEEVVRPTPSNALVSGSSSHSMAEASSAAPSSSSSGAGKKLRVRRSTFVPGWAVPPRVLLVDDDAVSRKLSSKFLKVFGCTIDVAVDGIGAVNKMNLEKYDLVLMDIVMPKLDGVSATNLIRKFDQGTPIISMTSNSKPNEIMTYYSSGMNDILPKPFTKEGLLDMLEKHLMHLKVIQQLSKVPRSIGVPPLSDANFEQALTTSANAYMQQQGQSSNLIEGPSGSSSSDPNAGGVVSAPSPFNFNFGDGDDDGRINPLAGMGLTDEQYNMILQNIVNGDGFMGIPDDIASGGNPSGSGLVEVPVGVGVGGSEKRPLDDPSEDGRDGKRGRFEVIE